MATKLIEHAAREEPHQPMPNRRLTIYRIVTWTAVAIYLYRFQTSAIA